MKKSRWVDLCLAFAFCAAIILNVRLSAHHSFAAEFDDSKPVKVTGTITNVEWKNPHIWFYVDVKNTDGTVTNWGFAGGAPGQLMRRGITKDQLKLGETIVVEGFRAKTDRLTLREAGSPSPTAATCSRPARRIGNLERRRSHR
jgi:Family of unknown function (DUF6152)